MIEHYIISSQNLNDFNEVTELWRLWK